jgi:hypothetical protein
MLASLFPYLNLVDGWMATVFSELVRVCLWGFAAGILSICLYAAVSNQREIAKLKAEARSCRSRLLDPRLDEEDFARLTKTNLKVSLNLLAWVIWPALLSAVPVLIVAVWMNAFYSYTAASGDNPVSLQLIPNLPAVSIGSQPGDSIPGENLIWIEPSQYEGRLFIAVAGQAIFSGNPFEPPTPVITKKHWWHVFIANPAGYLAHESPIDELQIGLPRKKFLANAPDWGSGWETPFFISVFIAALGIKLALRLE